MSASELVSAIGSGELLTDLAMPGWGLLLLAFTLVAIPMGPAEPTALAAGAAGTAAGFPLWLIVAVIAAGMLLGDLITFLSTGQLRRRLLRAPLSRARLYRWESRLGSNHLWRGCAVAGLRFIPGVRTPAAVAARGSGISNTQFYILTALGASAWALWWVSFASVMERISPEFLIVSGGVVLLLLLGWHYRCRTRQARRSRDSHHD